MDFSLSHYMCYAACLQCVAAGAVQRLVNAAWMLYVAAASRKHKRCFCQM